MRQLFYTLLFIFLFIFNSSAQVNNRQKGLLWEISGNGLKKPSFVYGTMHISSKLAFHLGDSFYLSLLKCDMVALEQNLDSVIDKWISEEELMKPENADLVEKRNTNEYLKLSNFILRTYDKTLIKQKLSAEIREVNYLLKRGNEDDFEEDAWLDLYIYQLGKRLKKLITGVESYEESKALVEKSREVPEENNQPKKKLKPYNNKMREQVTDAYRKGNIFMIDSIDRMTETDQYLEYMLYQRNVNMGRRIDSIIKSGKTLFTGVGCAHLPGKRGLLQILIDKGYKVRSIQSLANEKSKLAEKYENMTYAHHYNQIYSDDHIVAASLPAKLTKVRDNNAYTSYLSPDLANGYYYQIEKITCNTAFSGKTQAAILLEIDTMIFENIPGDVKAKISINSNGFPGIEIVTELKTGDLNRFQILVSPFNVYIVRLSGKKKFATSSDANHFFKSLKINEGSTSAWHAVSSGDSVFSILLPTNEKQSKLPLSSRIDPSFEQLFFEKSTGNTYLIKQIDFLNNSYIEEDTFELGVMAKSFSLTNNYSTLSRRQFYWQGYYALDAEFESKNNEKLYARFVICGTRNIMFLLKPGNNENAFQNQFFTSIQFNGKPHYIFSKYVDTTVFFSVLTPVKPLVTNQTNDAFEFEINSQKEAPNKYNGKYSEMYFKTDNANEFIALGAYRYGYYERQDKKNEEYFKTWEQSTSLKVISKFIETKNHVDYYQYELTDTNSNRRVKMMIVQNGIMRYYVSAFIDTVSGKSDFVNTFFRTFNVTDTIIEGNIFEKKGYRFFQDFTSKDSFSRKMSMKYLKDVVFYKEDIANLKNTLDSISPKSNAAVLRKDMIFNMGFIDSADALIIPYLQKLYARVSDTAFLQIEILQALARQRSEMAYRAIKPILSKDIPISDNQYEMENLLFSFSDSLKLTKLILPELMELTTISEYRNAAYSIISQMKDSGIIVPNDYAVIHNRLVTEARIEYKRAIAYITSEDGNSVNNFNDYEYENGGSSTSLLSSLLNLTLPLRNNNATVQQLVNKLLEITNNAIRIELLPVLLNNGVDFNDSVYLTLAKTEITTIRFYNLLSKAKQLNKFPDKYKSQKLFIQADIRNKYARFNGIDTIIYLDVKRINQGKKSYLLYIYKIQLKDENNWILYTSDPMPLDTAGLLNEKDAFPFYSQSFVITESFSEEMIISDLLFDTFMKYVRERNRGYYDENYNYQDESADIISGEDY